MKQRFLHRFLYRLRHEYLTLNNVVVAVAFVIAASWVWGSLGVMQRNYTLQQTLSRKNQELELATLETESLELEREYYKTREYQELAARERLGRALPGEKVLILPKQPASEAAPETTPSPRTSDVQPSNFEQWVTFFFANDIE